LDFNEVELAIRGGYHVVDHIRSRLWLHTIGRMGLP